MGQGSLLSSGRWGSLLLFIIIITRKNFNLCTHHPTFMAIQLTLDLNGHCSWEGKPSKETKQSKETSNKIKADISTGLCFVFLLLFFSVVVVFTLWTFIL